MGADPGQISRYENGRMTPSAEAVVKLAEVLDVSTDYLLVDTSPRRPSTPPSTPSATASPSLPNSTTKGFGVLRSVIDGLIAKSRLKTLAGGLNGYDGDGRHSATMVTPS